MKPSTKKVFEALLDRQLHSVDELHDMTGVKNIHAAVSEIRNVHRAQVINELSNAGAKGYRLLATEWDQVPVSPQTYLAHFAVPKLRRPKVTRPVVTAQPEVHTLILSDLHFGAKSPTVNFETTKRRLIDVGNVAFKAAAHRQSVLQRLEIDLIGDAIHGEGIYANQSWETDGPIPSQIDIATTAIGQLATAATKLYDEVVVNVVYGNHGRTSKLNMDISNWDYVLGMMLRHHLKPVKDVTVNLADSFYMVRERLGHRFFLSHGHQSDSMAMFHRNIPRWKANPEVGPFNVAECGHFHRFSLENIEGIPVIMNGTLQSGGNYGLAKFAVPEDLVQVMFGTTQSNAIEWLTPIRVD